MKSSSLQSRTIDALRFPCAVLVVLIHTFRARADSTEFPFSPFETLEVLLSQGISRIAVPIFFFISGFLFFSKLEKWDWSIYFGKIRNRARTLLVPYLLWVTLAILWIVALYLVRHFCFGWSLSGLTEYLSSKGWGLMYWNCARNYLYTPTPNLLGWTMHYAFPYNYPLWFIRDLIILCFLAPAIHYIIKKTKGWILAIIYLLYCIDVWIPWEGFSSEGFFFFSLGAFMQMRGKDILVTFGHFRFMSYILTVSTLVLCVLTYGNAPIWNYARRLLTLPGTIASFNICAGLLNKGWWKDSPFLAECSFPVYAGHAVGLTMITDILFNKLFPSTRDVDFFLRFSLRSTVIILFIMGIYYLAKRFLPKTTALFTGGRS